MKAERWRKVDATYEAVRARPPAARPELLRALCGEDRELQREVEDLLAAEERLAGEKDFLATPLDLERTSRAAGPAPAEDLEVPGYRLGAVLGRGGGGIVYRALRRRSSTEVALKVGWASLSKVERRRFRREQEILARLAHPGITALYEVGSTPAGRPYLAMELLDGAPIDRHCDRCRATVGERIGLFGQLCAAVHHVHGIGVVHRDLKPGNVLVTRDGRVKLLDFGIAKALDSASFHTRLDPSDSRGVRLLTPGYGSPEQISGRPITPASDVYSLAVLLFELLAGSKPYRFESGSPLLLDLLAVHEKPPLSLCEALELAAEDGDTARELCRRRGAASLAGLRRQLGRLESLLGRALSPSPAARPEGAAAFAAELRAAFGAGAMRGFFFRLGETLRSRNPQ